MENFLVFGVGGIMSKLIPLIMVPIVTRLMPNSEYFGVSDLSHTVVSFASALALMGMYDAMYRMFFEKEDETYKKTVCSTAFIFTLCMSFIIFLALILCRDWVASFIFGNPEYGYLVYITATAALVSATNSIISAPTRMQNKRKLYVMANILSPLISYFICIPLLLNGHYIIALPLSMVISGAGIEIMFAVINRKWFKPSLFDTKLLKQMLIFAIPLMPNQLIYWIFNSSDKLMIANMMSVAAEGVFSIGAKVGHISQLVYLAFSGGWQYFAFSTMREKDQVEMNSRIFEYLGAISFCASAFMCAFSYPVVKLLFTSEYENAYIVIPYLFLAPLLQMLFQVIGNQFLVIKKTLPIILMLSLGALLNIFLNWVLIPRIGIEGAALATLAGYVCTDIIATIVLSKMKLVKLEGRFAVAAAMMAAYFIAWRFLFPQNWLAGTLLAILFSCGMVALYRNDLRRLVAGFKMNRSKKGASQCR